MKRQLYKKTLKRKKMIRLTLTLSVLFVCFVVVALLSLRIYAQVAGAPNLTVQKASIFLDEEGNQIGDYYVNERRYWTSLDDISPYVIDATIAVEDKKFYDHNGFDYKRIAGAIVADIKAGAMVQGASTLTQQYAKNLYLTSDKTFSRKVNEALYAYRLEVFYTKDEILEGYLNTVYYGHGMYGIEAASKYYFAKSAKDLTLAESAMLAGIPKGPSYYSPNVNLEKATTRQHVILKLMAEQEKITADQQTEAKAEVLTFKSDEWVASRSVAPYFLDAVWNEATAILEEKNISIGEGGWTITTTLNQSHQKAAEAAVAKHMPQSDLQVGFVSMNPTNGHVSALVGGTNYATSQLNHVFSQRQPGSTIKPFLYAAALEQGYSPLTFKDVSETTFTYDSGRQTYTPKNANNQYAQRDLSLGQALAVSDNVYAVHTLVDIGYRNFSDVLQRFDLNYSNQNVPSLALGTTENTLYDLTTAYNTLAANGAKHSPTMILTIQDVNGKTIYAHDSKASTQAIDQVEAFLLTDMMTGMFDSTLSNYAAATGVSIKSSMTRPYAGKSGTTNTDQWMIGYTPSLTAGVWNGFDEGKKIQGNTEYNATKLIWISFMESVLANTPKEQFTPPAGVEGVTVDIVSGKIATNACEYQRFVYVKTEDVPTEKCSYGLFENRPWNSLLDLIPFSSWFE